MNHPEVAQAGAIIGVVGVALVLVPRHRSAFLAGPVLIAASMALIVYALVPGDDLQAIVGSPARVAAVALFGLALAGLAAAFVRVPAVVPVCILVAAPFRVPVTFGDQEAFLLLPLYAVLGGAVVALVYQTLRGQLPTRIPGILAVPAAAFIGLSGLSLLWADDLREGAVELLFFLLPFACLVAVVARAPVAPWLPKALIVTLLTLACGFAAVGLSQLWTENLYFARDLEVSNAYTSYVRTTSLFGDSSIYGRDLAVAIVVLVALLWLARIRMWAAAALVAFLWVGLYFAYSQSSMVALSVGVLALGLIAGDRQSRRVLGVASLALVIAVGAVTVATVRGDSAQRATSGRTALIEGTWRVFVANPVAGVGLGSQAQAARDEGGKRAKAKNASHTTPLTVAAELGALGLAAYVALLAGACRLLLALLRDDRVLGLALGSAFLVLFVHSLFYAGFFEDPLTWGILAVAAAVVTAEGARRAATEPPRSSASPAGAGEPAPAP